MVLTYNVRIVLGMNRLLSLIILQFFVPIRFFIDLCAVTSLRLSELPPKSQVGKGREIFLTLLLFEYVQFAGGYSEISGGMLSPIFLFRGQK